MSKPIKLDDDVYNELEEVRLDIETKERKAQTKSDAVRHLLGLRRGLVVMINTIEGNQEYAEHKRKQLAEISGSVDRRDKP